LGGVFVTLTVVVLVGGDWVRPLVRTSLSGLPTESLTADPGCDPGAQTCVAIEGGRRLALRFGSPIAPLLPFAVNVNLEGIAADAVSIEFRMEHMEMGINRFDLISDGGGAWRGQAVLPICWAGRRQWTAVISTLSGEVAMRATFGFAVVS
jgi:hypothetical protein